MAGNKPPYLPSIEEIYDRGEILQWMQYFRWKQRIIDSIMYHDNPTTQVVRKLVYKHGPDKAYILIKKFLEWTKEDGN